MEAAVIQPQAKFHTAQHGKPLLDISHFLIIIPHLGSCIQPWMHTWQERERGARDRKRKRDETFMTRRVGVGNHNENSKVNFSPGLSDESKDSLERCEGGEEGLGESVSEDSPWMWWRKKTEFIAGLLIPLFLFSIPPLIFSLFPIALIFHLFHPLFRFELSVLYLFSTNAAHPPPDVVGVRESLTTDRGKHQETGLGGGRCLSGDLWGHRSLHAVSTHTHTHTGSISAPLFSLSASACLSPSSRKCAVLCYDRWVAFGDRAAPTVCLSLLRMAAEWQLGPVHGFESVWQEKLGSFGLTHVLFQKWKEMRVSECYVAWLWMPFGKPYSQKALGEFWI